VSIFLPPFLSFLPLIQGGPNAHTSAKLLTTRNPHRRETQREIRRTGAQKVQRWCLARERGARAKKKRRSG